MGGKEKKSPEQIENSILSSQEIIVDSQKNISDLKKTVLLYGEKSVIQTTKQDVFALKRSIHTINIQETKKDFLRFMGQYYEGKRFSPIKEKEFSDFSKRYNTAKTDDEQNHIAAEFLEKNNFSLSQRMSDFLGYIGKDEKSIAKCFSPNKRKELIKNIIETKNLSQLEKKERLGKYFSFSDLLESLGYKKNTEDQKRIKERFRRFGERARDVFLDEVLGIKKQTNGIERNKVFLDAVHIKFLQTYLSDDKGLLFTIMSMNQEDQKRFNTLSENDVKCYLQVLRFKKNQASLAQRKVFGEGVVSDQLSSMMALVENEEYYESLTKKYTIEYPSDMELLKGFSVQGISLDYNKRQYILARKSEFVRGYISTSTTISQAEKQKIFAEMNQLDARTYLAAQKSGDVELVAQIWGSERMSEVQTYIAQKTVQDKPTQESAKDIFASSQVNAATIEESAVVKDVFKESLILKQFSMMTSEELLQFAENDTESPQQIIQRLEQKTTQIIKEQAVESCLQTVNMLFDTKFVGEKNRGEELSSNPNNTITMEGDYVHIKGKIDGEEIEVRYDIKTGNISIEQFIWAQKDQEKEGFEVNKQKFKDISIHMPSLSEYRRSAEKLPLTGITQQNFQEKVKKEIQEQTKSLLPQSADKNLFATEIKKNLLAQDILELVGIDISIEGISISPNDDTFKIYKSIFDSCSTYSSAEVQEMRTQIERFKIAMNAPENKDNPAKQLIRKFKQEQDHSGKKFLEIFPFLSKITSQASVLSISCLRDFLDEAEKIYKSASLPESLNTDTYRLAIKDIV